jgi:hypothetical protein
MQSAAGFGFLETSLMPVFQTVTFFPFYIILGAYALDYLYCYITGDN